MAATKRLPVGEEISSPSCPGSECTLPCRVCQSCALHPQNIDLLMRSQSMRARLLLLELTPRLAESIIARAAAH